MAMVGMKIGFVCPTQVGMNRDNPPHCTTDNRMPRASGRTEDTMVYRICLWHVYVKRNEGKLDWKIIFLKQEKDMV